jgi:hypothetical protein
MVVWCGAGGAARVYCCIEEALGTRRIRKSREEVIYVERSGQGTKMGEVENVAWQMRMVCVAPVCLSTKNVSSVTCSILADSGAGFSRQNTQAPAKAHTVSTE